MSWTLEQWERVLNERKKVWHKKNKSPNKKFKIYQTLKSLINNAMSNNIQALRNSLFDTLEQVKSGTMPLDKARVICEIAQGIINSGKLEVEFIKAIGGSKGTGFIELPDKPTEDAKVD